MLQCGAVGDAQIVVKFAGQSGALQALVDLRAGAVDQDQAHAQAVEQGDVVNDVGKVFVLRSLAPQHQHEGLAPVRVDVGCGIPEPAYMGPPRRRHDLIQAID